MAIYFGSEGLIELKRKKGRPLVTQLDPADVNTTKKRFSVDFDHGSLITGDIIEIATQDGSDLELVSGHNHPDGRWFIYVDEVGGVKLFDEFSLALAGNASDAKTLVTPSSSKTVVIQTDGSKFRPLAKVKEFEMTTTRENIDISIMGDRFKRQYENGTISGQGKLECIWEHQPFQKDNPIEVVAAAPEFPIYLSQLVLRIDQGADFMGRFYLYFTGGTSEKSVWYDAECLVSNIAISVESTDIIRTSIDFLTTGPVILRYGMPAFNLALESNQVGDVLSEGNEALNLQDPT